VKVATTVADFRKHRDKALRRAAERHPHARLALVPTMGALHPGHLSLITLAHRHAAVTAVSIFVNPLQFGPSEDYARYPRTIDTDVEACRAAGVDLVFAPPVTEIYPAGRQVSVNAGPMGDVFEGLARPGHFDGVLTVVLKLFQITGPGVAIFGRKDAQQLACIRRMVTDFNVPVEIVGATIIRDPDGLAMSSRNRFLSVADRRTALALPAALALASREQHPGTALKAAAARLSDVPGLELDYLALVNPNTMAEVGSEHVGPATMIVAARVGGVRLIDNADLEFAG
jgi:pantoate--beta-alanine ligase